MMLPTSTGGGSFASGRVTKSGVVHRKKCRHPKTPAELMRRYCLVCGAKAENYNFGVISCESCKAFFRRNAHKQMLGEAGFACSYRVGRCDVNLASRKKCPGCRLSKCFAVGMQAELIQKADSLLTSPPPLPPPPQLIPAAQLTDAAGSSGHCEQLLRLWQQLHTPASSSQPSVFTSPEDDGSTEHACTNILLVDFFAELRRLVRDTVLCDIVVPPASAVGSAAPGQLPSLALLEAFVHQTAKFISGLRQVDRLDREHLLTLLRYRLHSVLFPLSCAGYCAADGRFYFTVSGRRACCQPIELFCDLVRHSSSRLVDATPLAQIGAYTRQLMEVTEMRPELLALFCAAKLLCLPSSCAGVVADERMRGACARLALRYHQHLVDSLFYHYPFEFDEKLRACCRLFKWSFEFDRALESFFQFCPLSAAGVGSRD